MATENKILDLSFPAIEDLRLDQYRFVVITETGVRRPNSNTELAFGILQNAPGNGQDAAVRVLGVSKLEMNAEVAVGAFVGIEYVDSADAGKGEDKAAALAYARGIVLEPSGAEGDLASVMLIGPVPAITATPAEVTTVTTDATAGANTWTAGELIGGLCLRDPNGANRSDVTPTAAQIVAAVTGAVAGSSFDFTIRNTADANETITLTAGAGVTLSGDMTIGQRESRSFRAVVTNAGAGTEAVTLYNLDTTEKQKATVTINATAGDLTYTAAMLKGKLILRDPNGGARNDVTPTAAQIVAAIAGAAVGSSIEFDIRNTADADETITVTAGAGVTLSGTMTIAQNNTKLFRAVCTNVGAGTEAVMIYSIGSMVH